jgi:hypothetical protein
MTGREVKSQLAELTRMPTADRVPPTGDSNLAGGEDSGERTESPVFSPPYGFRRYRPDKLDNREPHVIARDIVQLS